MSLRCHLLGHKHKTGSFTSYDQLMRCVRCDKQLIYPVGDVILNTLEGQAERFREEADRVEPVGLEKSFKDRAELCDEAAEVLRSDKE